MISDTTIAATRTQGCEMGDKFRENFRIVLPAALVTVVLFLVLAGRADAAVEGLSLIHISSMPSTRASR